MEQLKTTVIDYKNGIYGIDQQMVRAFLIVGTSSALLLDTGAVPADIKAFIKEITNLPVTVVLTHGDGDHIGNLSAFSQAYVCEKDAKAVLSHPQCRDITLLPLSEGQMFDVGGRVLKVLFTPGHTVGSVCLLDEQNKILFAGDTVSRGPVFMFGERRDMNAYKNTLQALKKQKDNGDFTQIYCCHNVCPLQTDAVEALICCVDGIIGKTIVGTKPAMPLPTEESTLLYKSGDCMILY